MELRQLTHFLAVAEERHFTRAAQRVHLTQSSLSSSIRSLERELGSELFVRSTRQVELTQAGRALTPAARRAVAASEEAKDAVAGVRGLVRGQLTIGAIQLRGLLDIPALLARYHRRHPAVALRLRHDSVTSLVRRTADGELELAIVDLPLGPQANRVRAHALGTEALQLAVLPMTPWPPAAGYDWTSSPNTPSSSTAPTHPYARASIRPARAPGCSATSPPKWTQSQTSWRWSPTASASPCCPP